MENIKSTPVYPYEFKTDRYGNTEYNYPEESAYNLELIWLPISSQVEIAEYGERINEMMQACLFSDDEIKEKISAQTTPIRLPRQPARIRQVTR